MQAKQHCPDPPKVSPHPRKIVVALGDCSNNPILRGLRVKMPNSKVGRVEEWVHESVRPNFPAKSTWRECHLQNFRLRRARGEGVWGSSFCSLTAVGRRVPRRKNRCGQGEKSVPPLTISARACIGLPIRAIPPVEIGDSARSAESPMCASSTETMHARVGTESIDCEHCQQTAFHVASVGFQPLA